MYIPTDRESGRPRGFAFATFSSDGEAAKAIELFHQRDVGGRRLNVNAAEERPRGPRPGGFGGPPGGGGGGYGGAPRSFGGPPGGAPRPYSGGAPGGGGFGGPPRPFGVGAGPGGPSKFEADRGAKSGNQRRFNEKRPRGDERPAAAGAGSAAPRAKGGGGSKRWRGDADDF